MRRHKIITQTIFVLCAISLIGCATTERSVDIKRAIALKQVEELARAAHVGNSRVRVDSSATFFQDLRVLEYNALVLAAKAALEADAPFFAITYIDYHNDDLIPINLGGSDLSMGAGSWIGSYESLLTEREMVTLGENLPRRFGFQKMTLVARLLTEEERAGRPAFEALETLNALLDERVARKGID